MTKPTTRIVTSTTHTPTIIKPALIAVHADDEKLYRSLIEAARSAAGNAYCPYSNYDVGAAVLTFDGLIYPGCNVESCAYSQTIHAEENAVAGAVASGLLKRAEAAGLTQFDAIVALAVWGSKCGDPWPCCNCRQFLSDFGYNMHIIGEGPQGKDDNIVCLTLGQLIPNPFPIEEVLASVRGEK